MTRADTIWSNAHDRTTAIEGEVGRLYLDICAIGSLWPQPTYPETRAVALADRLEAIAAGLRDSARLAEERRKEAA